MRLISPHPAVILSLLALPAASVAVEPPSTAPTVAIVGANLVPMTAERVIERTTVIVADGVITAIGPEAEVAVPKNARVIEARDKYLLPGLAEMHAHIPDRSGAPSYLEEVLFLYVANGVTLARGMLGAPEHLQLRADLLEHKILGPRLITSGPSLNGNSVKDAEQGARMVREQKAAGYDFVKLHPGLSRDSFIAIARTAHEVEIPFGGHVSADVGLATTLSHRQATIDHLDGYMLAVIPEANRQGAHPDNIGLALQFDQALLPEVVRMTRTAQTWIVPTQSLSENSIGHDSPEHLDARPEMRYVPSKLRAEYRSRKQSVLDIKGLTPQLSNKFIEVRRSIIRALHEGGVGMLLGSDSPQIFNVPGFAAHRELQAMVDAGLTAYQALRMGTAAPAEFFNQSGRYGTVVVGSEADLMLVQGNPLQDVRNAQRIEAVMVRGRWLDRAFLDRELGAIAARLSTGKQ